MKVNLKHLTSLLITLNLLLILPLSAAANCGDLDIQLKTRTDNDYCILDGKKTQILSGFLLKPASLPAAVTSNATSITMSQGFKGPNLVMAFDCLKYNDKSYYKSVIITSQQNYCFLKAGDIRTKTTNSDLASSFTHKGKYNSRAGFIRWTLSEK